VLTTIAIQQKLLTIVYVSSFKDIHNPNIKKRIHGNMSNVNELVIYGALLG
jgi:hypothetical protein